MKKQLDLFDEENKKEIEKQILELKNDLNYDTRDYPVEFIVSLYENDSRIFTPDYQREESLWSILYKSRFIESLILDYPRYGCQSDCLNDSNLYFANRGTLSASMYVVT